MSLVDTSVLEELRKIEKTTGQNIVDEILQEFLDIVGYELEQLEVALLDNKMEIVEQIAHKMKSSTANVGAIKLSELLGQIEYSSDEDDGPLDELIEKFKQIKEILPETIEILQRL